MCRLTYLGQWDRVGCTKTHSKGGSLQGLVETSTAMPPFQGILHVWPFLSACPIFLYLYTSVCIDMETTHLRQSSCSTSHYCPESEMVPFAANQSQHGLKWAVLSGVVCASALLMYAVSPSVQQRTLYMAPYLSMPAVQATTVQARPPTAQLATGSLPFDPRTAAAPASATSEDVLNTGSLTMASSTDYVAATSSFGAMVCPARCGVF